MIKSEQLYYLIEVAKYSSINKAAEKLFMSKSAISTSIKQLERECGYEIIERTYRGIKLTEKGQKVLKIAEQIIESYDEIISLGMEDKDKLNEKINLIIDRQSSNLLVKKILGVKSKVPLFFNIIEYDNNDFIEIIQKIDEKNIALSILTEMQKREIEEKGDITITELYSSRLYPVSKKNTKHIDKKCNKISAEMIDKIPKVLMGRSLEYNNNVVLRTDNPSVYSEAILNDYGIGFLTKFSIDVSIIDKRMFKIYEPFDDEMVIAILNKSGENINKVELLKSIIKT